MDAVTAAKNHTNSKSIRPNEAQIAGWGIIVDENSGFNNKFGADSMGAGYVSNDEASALSKFKAAHHTGNFNNIAILRNSFFISFFQYFFNQVLDLLYPIPYYVVMTNKQINVAISIYIR